MKYDKTEIPSCYAQARKLPDETIELWLSIISKYVPSDSIKTIVDLGCGIGRFSKALAAHFSAQVYGIDPSWKMLKEAKDTIQSSKVTFRHGSAESIPLTDGSADLIFLSQVYHHIDNKKRAFSEITRVLKKDRFLCIRSSTVENLDTVLYLRFFPQVLIRDKEYLPSRREIMDIIDNNGGVRLKGHEIVQQKFASNLKEYYKKIKLRGLSDLASINDEEFHAGLSKLETYCKEHDIPTDVIEDLDFFIYIKT
jgi:ubiquinone/menaquinone biosynthesis C-methylase UbiE